jgi:hypothetical protein
MTQSHPLAAQSIPVPIQWALNAYGERLRRAGALGDQMAKLEVRITETEKMLQQMRHHYATIGREHTTMRGDAELLLVMIQQACARVGIDVPLQSDRQLLNGAETRRAIGHGDMAVPRADTNGDAPADAADDGAAADAETAGTAEKDIEKDPTKDTEGDAADDMGQEPEDAANEEAEADAEADDVTAIDAEEDFTLVQTVRDRHQAGVSQRAIARELDIDRRRVKRILEEPMSEVPAG